MAGCDIENTGRSQVLLILKQNCKRKGACQSENWKWMKGIFFHERIRSACKGNNGCFRRKILHLAESVMQKCGASLVEASFPRFSSQRTSARARALAHLCRSWQIPDNRKNSRVIFGGKFRMLSPCAQLCFGCAVLLPLRVLSQA